MSNNDTATNSTPVASQSIPGDVDVSQYENEYVLEQQDVLPVAQFFNQVGGDLTKLDRHNVDGAPVLKLDKNKVIPPTYQGQQAAPQQVHQHNIHQPAAVSAPQVVPASTVTLKDLEHIQKLEKKLSTASRKIVALEKRVSTIESIVTLPKKKTKYNIKTDDVDCTTSNIDVLMSTLCEQITNGAVNINILKC